jgi:small subunit ribosomal protein S6
LRRLEADGWKLFGEQMNRTYELMFIVRPDMAEEDLDKLISTLEGQVTTTGGTVKNVERMGKRRLAYMVRRFSDGMYILLTVEGTGELIHELERRLRVTEPVIKFLTVRIDEEQKRLDKIKQIRDARRKAVPAPATPEAGSEPAPATA